MTVYLGGFEVGIASEGGDCVEEGGEQAGRHSELHPSLHFP